MRPQPQGILHDGAAGVMGDCWRTCIASILEFERDSVPNFVEEGGPDDETGAWWTATNEWLGRYGLQIVEWEIGDEQPWAPPAYTILTGPSPRGDFDHSVVGYGIDIEHDPHPSRAGLAGPPKRVAVFVAVNPAKAIR